MTLPDCVRPDYAATTPVLDALAAYMAAASFYFVVVFLADVRNRYVRRNPWYLNKYISLNAISLTALAIATKYSTDLTTPMMKPWEQLSKLTCSILVCTVMAFAMPSLGAMNRTSSIVSNVGALFILVVTLMVDLGIQIRTKIIVLFWREQIVVMMILFLQLLFLVSTAVVVPTMKELMEEKSDFLSYAILNFPLPPPHTRLKEIILEHWLVAHPSNPQYVVARSPTCLASNILCLVNTSVIIVAMARLFNSDVGRRNICKVNYDEESGYSSEVVLLIVVIQLTGILLGTIGTTSRCMWWSEVVFQNCKFHKKFKESMKRITIDDDCFVVEDYWISSLVKWMDAPLRMNFNKIVIRKIMRFFKWCVLTILIKLQIVIVMVSKLIRAFSVVPMLPLHKILHLRRIDHQDITTDERILLCNNSYFLQLEEEKYLRKFILKESCNKKAKPWILLDEMSQTEEEENRLLLSLMTDHFTLKQDKIFCFVDDFVADIDPYTQRRTTNQWRGPTFSEYSWALLLATLSCIIERLPGTDQSQVKLLLKGVNRGLRHVRFIENTFDDKTLVNMRDAAELVGVDRKFSEFDHGTFGKYSTDKPAREVVEELKEIADKQCSSTGNIEYFERPPIVQAANCMRTVCSAILQNYDRYKTDVMLFEWLRTTTLDILGACLTNIPDVIQMQCSKKSIEVREEGVENAANLFAQTKQILELLYDPYVALRFPENKKRIEDWHRRDTV